MNSLVNTVKTNRHLVNHLLSGLLSLTLVTGCGQMAQNPMAVVGQDAQASAPAELTMAADFSTQALSGQPSLNSTTPGSNRADSRSATVRGFESFATYEIVLTSNQPMTIGMEKIKNGVGRGYETLSPGRRTFVYNAADFNFDTLHFKNATSSKSTSYTIKVTEISPPQRTLSAGYQNQYRLSGKNPSGSPYGTNFTDGQRNSACGPTAAAMLVHARGKAKKSSLNDEAIYLYKEFGTTTSEGSVGGTVASRLSSLYGFRAENVTSNLWNVIVEEINAGRPVIFRSWSMPNASNTGTLKHYVLVRGYQTNRNGRQELIVNDPNPSSGNGRVIDFANASRSTASVIRAR